MFPAAMAMRSDISNKVIHFTRGDSERDAFAVLKRIIAQRRLLAGNGPFIKGGYRCVCFTEAPLRAFTKDFLDGFLSKRYSPFGLMFTKSWVYEHGGRPVIYQPESDFAVLPEELRWRHVRFDLSGPPLVDFSWEREWRIPCDELPFSETEAVIIVPDRECAEALLQTHRDGQDSEIQNYAFQIGAQIAECFREGFRWRAVPLH